MMRGMLCVGLLLACLAARADEPSFELDVMPILSKAGCNGGGCHGALAGKAGFRLSLFGYDPASDHLAITRDARGRRIDPVEPGASLLLTKPTMAIAHKGGKRLEVGGDDYRRLAAWIEAGCPGPKQGEKRLTGIALGPAERTAAPGSSYRLQVTATYDDGSSRDVTHWTRFTSADETIATVDPAGTVNVLGHGAGAVTAWFSSQIAVARVISPFPHDVAREVFAAAPRANFIDEHNLVQLEKLRLAPSPPCDEATFLRRAFLDTIGRLPTAEEIREHLADRSPEKKERLVDLLLARPEFVDYWAYKWADVLLVSGIKLKPVAVEAYAKWIRDRVADNTPWDRFVREIVTSRGSNVENGATNFYGVHQDPETVAENVSQAFLGLSINCAKCHNHPLEKWTNDQYYAFANLFARVRAKGWGGVPNDSDGLRTLFVERRGDLLQPKTGRPQQPAPLDGTALEFDDPGDRRQALADWLVDAKNPYFTRAIVNRVWANFFGMGLVEPVDDLRATNPASDEPLLAALAEFTVKEGYDLRRLMRLILLSATYARSSVPVAENRDDRRWFARAYPKRLMAEVLHDAVAQVTQVPTIFKTKDPYVNGDKGVQFPAGWRAVQLPDVNTDSYFTRVFGRPLREQTCECERTEEPNVTQALHIANGDTLNAKLHDASSVVGKIAASKMPVEQWLEDAYLAALGRLPSAAEKAAVSRALADAKDDQRPVMEDVFWALMSNREFIFNH